MLPDEVRNRVAAVKESGLFLEQAYALLAEARLRGQDPVEHYLLHGEARGARPSGSFDPSYYAARYGIRGDSPLIHYILFGREKGLRTRPMADEFDLFESGFQPGRPRFLLFAGEGGAALAPGAPALCGALQAAVDVTLVCTDQPADAGGLPRGAVAAVARPRAALPAGWMRNEIEASRFAAWLSVRCAPDGVICGSQPGMLLLPHLARAFVPALILLEGCLPAEMRKDLAGAAAYADTVLFATEELMQRHLEKMPALLSRRHAVLTPAGAFPAPGEWGGAIIAAMEAARERTQQIRADVELLANHAPLLQAVTAQFSLRQGGKARIRNNLLVRGRDTGAGPIFPAPKLLLGAEDAARLRAPPGAPPDAALQSALGRLEPQAAARHVIRPRTAPDRPSGLRAALHGHYYYPELLDELLDLLALNREAPDLFLSTDTAEKRDQLLRSAAARGREAEVRILPNRGRDVAPFFAGFPDLFAEGRYDAIGHLHSKKSPHIRHGGGDDWRRALLGGVIGVRLPMMDIILQELAADSRLGLAFPGIANACTWDDNFREGESLARRIDQGAGQRPDLARRITRPFFDYPAGMMFWCRPQALRPLIDLGLGWEDFPPEPLPGDGTIAHAIERILPFVCEAAGYDYAIIWPKPAA